MTIGDVVTQRQAKHWNQGDTGLCPFCRGEEEDEIHRWFRCPAWSAAHTKAGFQSPALALEQQLPQAMATWGLPVLPPSVAEWKTHNQARVLQIPHLPVIAQTQVMCVDGSGLFPKDAVCGMGHRMVRWPVLDHQSRTSPGSTNGAPQ